MEATVVSVGKAVLDGVLGCAKSTVAEEMRQQHDIDSDVDFFKVELQMMQSFLMAADEEQDQNKEKVPTTLVRQVRDLAYNVEDCLLDATAFRQLEKPSWRCIAVPRNLHARHRIAMELKDLKEKVGEVSRRNKRYHIINEGTKHATLESEQGHIAKMFGIAWRETMQDAKRPVDLVQLINSEEMELRVIAVWGTGGDLGKTIEIRNAYDDPKVKAKFRCRAWVRLMHPFSPREFLESLVRQFYVNSSRETSMAQEGTAVGGNVLLMMENMRQSDLVQVFNQQVNRNRYLIVINDLSTIEEWDCIRTYFPDKKMQSRIVVNTQQVEIACLCTEQKYQVSELKRLSSDQILYLFHKKIWYSEMSTNLTIEKKIDRSKAKSVIPEDTVLERTIEKQKLFDSVGRPDDSQGCKVISISGMDGIGKTTFIRRVYQSPELCGWKRAWATVSRPFNRDMLLRTLALQLQTDIQEHSTGAGGVTQKNVGATGYQEMTSEIPRLLGTDNCLIVLDDLSSTEEWDSIRNILAKSKRIIVTTRNSSIAKHCSGDDKNVYNLAGLEDKAAHDLFKKKVFKDDASFDLHPCMLDEAKLILKKCDGLPLAISTVGCYLANKPKTTMEWKKLNDSLNDELEISSDPKTTRTVLMRSYDCLPYHLKPSFLYLSIFPENHIIQRKRLVRRWIAEDYCGEIENMKAEQIGDMHFDDLLDRSMILPLEGGTVGKIHSCQLHDLIREICVSKARAENFVFTLEEGCSLPGTIQGVIIRHLAISSNWKRDRDVPTTLDLSHVRSLTVFGEWRSFFISKKMRFLRVLDLEHTIGLRDHHLDKIGEFLHMRYLSLRGCGYVFKLPESLGKLSQLQTLDVRGTHIWMLPTAVTKLQKLQYLYASGFLRRQEEYKTRDDTLRRHGAMRGLEAVCLGRNGRHLVEEGGFSRHDIYNMYGYLTTHREDAGKIRGVNVPKGISKLKALHTLRVVNIAQGNAIIQELRELTQLCKLGVTGISKKNCEKFWLAAARHNGLRSLSVYSPYENEELDGCLGRDLLPPKRLESLKMHGKLVKVTEWIHRLQNLSKLQLQRTELNQDALQAIGTMLPNLAVLRLKEGSLSLEERHLHFHGSSFPGLLVLELHALYHPESLRFEHEATPKLQVLQAYRCARLKDVSGLRFLTSLMEIRLDSDLNGRLQRQLAKLPNNVVLKLL